MTSAPGRAPAVVVVAMLALLMIAACGSLDVVGDAADRERALMGWRTISAVVGAIAVATVVPVLWRRPRHPAAWVIALTRLLWGFDGLGESWSAYGMAHTPYLPLTGFAVWDDRAEAIIRARDAGLGGGS